VNDWLRLTSEYPGEAPSCDASTKAMATSGEIVFREGRCTAPCRTCGAQVEVPLVASGNKVVAHHAPESPRGATLFT
jgi:hypothetical protein